MKEHELNINRRKAGSAMVISIIMLAVAGVTLGAVLSNSMSYSRQASKNGNLDKAMLLADAGLRAAVVKLNATGNGTISLSQSHSYFSNTTPFDGAIWGFQTVVVSNQVVSVGTYQSLRQEVEATVYLGSGSRSIHQLYNLAMYAGNSDGDTNYVMEVGGAGSGVDFVKGDVYSAGDIALSGDAELRNPEVINEVDFDGMYDAVNETWDDAFAVQVFSNPLTKVDYDSYVASVSAYSGKFYNNGEYDVGEPYVDSMGNGVYDEGEPFNDANGDGIRNSGDGYVDVDGNGFYEAGIDTIVDNGNGQWDEGEEWTEDSSRSLRRNGVYDPAGGYWSWSGSSLTWNTTYTYWRRGRRRTASCSSWPAEKFEDSGDDSFDPGESYVDGNGIYDEGEEYLDDRNGLYDYGTQAYGTISGMPSAGPGQKAASGGSMLISPPNLELMYYDMDKDVDAEPYDALGRWGHDVAVTAEDYNGYMAITDPDQPEHIFIRNPSTSSSQNSNGAYIRSRSYDYTYNTNSGNRVDDYFLEDPTDGSYNSPSSSGEINNIDVTRPMYVDVKGDANEKVYYVDGNLYLHSPVAMALRFKNPGTKITIVAKGNITISDEFYYNAAYESNVNDSSDIDSTIVKDPEDLLCLIALKNDACPDSGNVYIGDAQFGTGGSIHALLYAENNFVDNNLDTSGQPFISVFGNMTAGNQVQLNRTESGGNRTRLDVTLDDRIRKGEVTIPGLPHAINGQISIQVDTEWHMVPGTWKSWSMLQ